MCQLLGSNPLAGQQDVFEVAEQQHLGSRLPACRLRSLAFPPLMTGCLAATPLLVSKMFSKLLNSNIWAANSLPVG
jgi:hypothetical protein